jgi:hypothetical protein
MVGHLLRVTVPAEVEFDWDAGGFDVGVSRRRVAIPAGSTTFTRAVETCDAARINSTGDTTIGDGERRIGRAVSRGRSGAAPTRAVGRQRDHDEPPSWVCR